MNNPLPPSSQSELLELANRYLDKVEKFVTDVTKATGQLDAARQSYEKAKSSVLPSVMPYFLLIIVLIVAVAALYFIPCGTTFKGGGVEFAKSCPSEPSTPAAAPPVPPRR
jgi:hypothetical protein